MADDERGEDEPVVDEPLVRRLLDAQHPDLADRPLTPVGAGWDNRVWRLGDDLAVRLPTRVASAPLLAHELRWLPELLDGVPSFDDGGLDATPHLRAGRPGAGYPWDWAVTAWHEGEVVTDTLVRASMDAASRLGRFLAAIHRPAPAEAPPNPWRGVPLVDRDLLVVEHLDRLDELGRPLGDGLDRQRIEACWRDLGDAAPDDGPPLWLHGDLHVGNLVVRHGTLAAVIDFGDLTRGDRATDLAVAWGLFPDDPTARQHLRAVAGSARPVDDATWRRSRAWAVALNLAYLQGEHSSQPFRRAASAALAAAVRDR